MRIIIPKYQSWLATVVWMIIFLIVSVNTAIAQSTVFTYQGRLTDGHPASGRSL